jgi:hypothetical protein
MSSKTHRYVVLPITTLLASSPDGSAVAGFAMRAPLARCLRESDRVRQWAQQATDEVLYELRVGDAKRVVRDGDALGDAIRALHYTATHRPSDAASGLLDRILMH